MEKRKIDYIHCACIDCRGIPINAWTNDMFCNTVNLCGELLSFDDETLSMKMFEKAKSDITAIVEAIYDIIEVVIGGI